MTSFRETTLPDRSTTVGTTLQPPHPSLSSAPTKSKMDELELNHATADQPRLPDLSNVLYKETYDEYTRVKNPVVLVSHCWSSHQTLYVGCRGGQLLRVDFDSGFIEVLANTQVHTLYCCTIRKALFNISHMCSWVLRHWAMKELVQLEYRVPPALSSRLQEEEEKVKRKGLKRKETVLPTQPMLYWTKVLWNV